MRFVTRTEQDDLTEERSYWRRPAYRGLDDKYFDGEPLPRELVPRHWRAEGDVHEGHRASRSIESTRFFRGPEVTILRDDLRRTTWVGLVEDGRLVVRRYPQAGPGQEDAVVAHGDIWRYHIALDKFTGEVTATWVATAEGRASLWHAGSPIKTDATSPDFPSFAYSQVPVGRIQEREPAYGFLAYKDRDSGRVFGRRVHRGRLEGEQVLLDEPTVGGMSVAVFEDDVVGRVDLLRDGQLIPAFLLSHDGGRTFEGPNEIDLSVVVRDNFVARPGFQRPIVDKGGSFHMPIGMESTSEALLLNFVMASDLLVEAIRVPGQLRKGDLEVFPSTLGSGNTFGNGVSDGHGLIMVLNTEEGLLFSSNSSAGGGHFPEAKLLNHEMPLVAEFSASECYSSGHKPNVVSMDYLFVEANGVGRPISGELFVETWDMPLPEPRATAKAKGKTVAVSILNDADLEPGKVTFDFDDPGVAILDVSVHDLRSATVRTNRADLRGKTISFDVLTQFHRHYGEALIE